MDNKNIKIVKVTAVIAVDSEETIDRLREKWEDWFYEPSELPTLIDFDGVEMTLSEKVTEEQLKEKTTTEKPKKRGRPKGSKNRKSKTAKSTKKAMKDLKKNKRVFTGAFYGWNAKKDGSLVPNWKEQNNIDWMKAQIEKGVSASAVAKILNKCGLSGKRGGKWNSSSVLRTTRNKFHNSRDEKEAPMWFKDRTIPHKLNV